MHARYPLADLMEQAVKMFKEERRERRLAEKGKYWEKRLDEEESIGVEKQEKGAKEEINDERKHEGKRKAGEGRQRAKEDQKQKLIPVHNTLL